MNTDLIERVIKNKWEHSQELERKYNEENKPQKWGVPYSFKFWADLIELKDFDGLNIEVGCGSDGFWRFSDKIIGTDSLDFSQYGKNFIQANAENLPFEDNHFRDCYAMNMLDHTEHPQKALNEMIRVSTNRIYIFSNIFSPIVKPIMNEFDQIHPYHFTEKDLISLVPDTVFISMSKRKLFVESLTAGILLKLKLDFALLLGTHRLLVHLDKKDPLLIYKK
jgi:SAM-dependent methyltransferase